MYPGTGQQPVLETAGTLGDARLGRPNRHAHQAPPEIGGRCLPGAGRNGRRGGEVRDDTKKKGKKKLADTDAEADDDVAPLGEKTDTLIFLSPSEISKLAEAFQTQGFDPDKVITQAKQDKQAGELAKLIGKPNLSVDGLDIALFGRMVAQAATMNVEAAASFAHAISTHKVTNEVEFFTALDDLQEEPGSAHMGSLEFNSATYYRYVSLDVGQLWQSLCGVAIPEAVEAFVKALYVAVPSARQTTQSGACPWEFARVFVRKGQRLQAPFETAIKAKDGGFLEPSKVALTDYLSKKEKLAGSLFGKKAAFSFGDDESFSIDDLIRDIKNAVEGAIGNG
jgi:CRISPR system Cascade subunit CasC